MKMRRIALGFELSCTLALAACGSGLTVGNSNSSQIQYVCNNGSGATLPTTTTTLPNGSLITPYVNQSDIPGLGNTFVTNVATEQAANLTSGVTGIHYGHDFLTSTDHIPFQAVIDGTFYICPASQTQLPSGGTSGNWAVPVFLLHGSWLFLYNQEIFSTSTSDVTIQKSYEVAQNGQSVHQGDLLFYLHRGGPGSHVHFDIQPDTIQTTQAVCPTQYFTASAFSAILTLSMSSGFGSTLCYQ